MAGGNIQPGTSVPEQTPPTYGPQPAPMYGQPYMPPATPTDFGDMMRKTFLLIAIFVGAILMFIGRLVGIYSGTGIDVRIAQVLWAFGAFMIAAPAVIYGVGSKRVTDLQKIGLMLLAGILFAAMTI